MLANPPAGLGAVALPVTAASDGQPGSNRASPVNAAYIVQLADMPVTAYQGGTQGYTATKPRKNQKIDPDAPAVVSYMAYLGAKHDRALAGVGASKKLYTYGYVFNGFAAELRAPPRPPPCGVRPPEGEEKHLGRPGVCFSRACDESAQARSAQALSAEQAQKMAQMPGVLAVTKDVARSRDTATTPGFLGLSGPTGVWAGAGVTGENVIIGIVDGGAWPEHPSLSDRTGSNGNASKDGKLSYQQIPGWHGKCQPGEQFTGTDCNQKLIGARYYNAGWGGNAGIDAQLPWEYNSPRDFGGHGTHTATTAGGNAGVAASGAAAVFGSVSGMAPSGDALPPKTTLAWRCSTPPRWLARSWSATAASPGAPARAWRCNRPAASA